ncbi:GTPase of uncharacterised function family protein [Helicobacter fennelliae]|nr:GTPase of uncharacterised function family protein [Helicobacter fennelliae]
MLATQKSYLKYLGKLDSLISGAKDLSLVDSAGITKQIAAQKDAISAQELLVPVVGGFSVGKSSLLNDFLGDDALFYNSWCRKNKISLPKNIIKKAFHIRLISIIYATKDYTIIF